MPSLDNESLRQSIQQQAFRLVPPLQREKVNLYLDSNILAADDIVGPEFQQIRAPRASILVFADLDPTANFGHPCMYHFFDASNGNLVESIPARFPPYGATKPKTFVGFHLPVRTGPTPSQLKFPPIWRCPILLPHGARYAILYSGMSNMRHLNDLEFCYRMLIDRYDFAPAHITALSYDGTLNTQDGMATTWPGDGSAYRIKIDGPGDSTAFKAAIASLKSKLKHDDLLFIHTNNHGDNFGQGSFLCTYPNYGTYTATDFCADLAILPKYRALMVMMEQCNSGGFNAPVLAASTAHSTSIGSAAIATQSSYASPDGNWDSFARDWIAAEIGHAPNGAALAHNPDTDGDGVVSANEAFNYALSVQNPSDSPNYSSTSTVADKTGLAETYILWWVWCILLAPLLQAAKLDSVSVQPALQDLQKFLPPAIDKAIADLRANLNPEIQAILKRHFR
jgi:hypothetical protein